MPWGEPGAELTPAMLALAAATPEAPCHCWDSGDLLCVVGVLLLDRDTEAGLKGSEALRWPEKPRRVPIREPGRKGATGWLPP